MGPYDECWANTYKEFEEDVNQKILSMTNCYLFIAMLGQSLDAHLDYIVMVKKQTKELLDDLDLPCRDDIALLAKRVIEIESRLDNLDENLYDTLDDMKNYQTRLKELSKELATLSFKSDDTNS